MRIAPRRRATKLLGIRFNRSGLRLTSVSVGLGDAFRLVLWERKRATR